MTSIANSVPGAYRARDYDGANEWFDRQIAIDPAMPLYALSALVHVQRGDMARARAVTARVRELLGAGPSPADALYAYVCAACGDTADALELLRQIEARRAGENVWLVGIAMAYARLGEVDTAVARLEEAVEERGGWIAWLAVEPALDPLRADPRFTSLVRRVGLVPSQ